MNSGNATIGDWHDEAVALAIADVLHELPEIDCEAVALAAQHCRAEVLATRGLALLRHRIRQRALGIALVREP